MYLTCTRLSLSLVRLSRTVPLHCRFISRSPTTPAMPKHNWFRLIPVRSPLLRESLLFSFPPGNEMFQFPGFASSRSWIPCCHGGLPHSDICGLTVICTSPQLVAAYHVLLRLKEPRHPPYALIYFLSPIATNISANDGFLLYAFLLKLCFFQHVNELRPPPTPPKEGSK